MGRERGKILVIRGGAIGDFILTLPALRALREHFSETHLELLSYPRIAGIAREGGLIDTFRSIESRALAGFFARNGDLDDAMVDYFSEFSLILSYLYDPDELFKENLARATTAQFVQGPHRPDEKLKVHAAEAFLKPLEKLAIFGADPVPAMKVPGGTRLRGKWLAIHPGSGSESKNWSLERWGDLLLRIMEETELNILLVGGEADSERLRNLQPLMPPERFRLAENLALAKLAQLLQQTSAFVGHDSGITHLASALGVPAFVLWGDTNLDVWRPLGTKVRIIRSTGGLEAIAVEEVWSALVPAVET